jgi:lysophospholipase L1-like esterase
VGQVLIARRTIPGAEAPPPRSNGTYGATHDGPALRLAVLGDSTAAGYGVATRDQTPGALLSTWIADAARRPVRLTCPAVVGSVSAWLPGQVEAAVEAGVDLAIILIGANDVTTRAADSTAVRHLSAAVTSLRAAGAEVVVATCPDLGTIRPIRRPLRWLARRWSRQLAQAQTIAVVRAGGRTVSLVDLLGPQFDAAPDRMFGHDRFHPSAEGYIAAATVILPAALTALGLAPEPVTPGPAPSLPKAAAAAAEVAGREVAAATVADTRPGALRRQLGVSAGWSAARLAHARASLDSLSRRVRAARPASAGPALDGSSRVCERQGW